MPKINRMFTFLVLGPMAFALASPCALAQDDALDRLLEKAQETEAAKTEKPKDGDQAKPDDAKPKSKPAAKDEPKDKALDDLLEKLGQSEDTPETTGRAQPARPESQPDESSAPKPKAEKQDTLDPRKRPLDQHLEELTGRKRKNPEDDQDQAKSKSDPSEGALAEAIKKMREVEQRLGQEDTGESTREKQEQIVKDLDQMIKLARQMRRNQKPQPGTPQPGQQQPGDEQNNPNDPQRGTNANKPKTPNSRDMIAENKDIWGHLPPAVRAELENSFKAEGLPKKRALIDRYYLSIMKKSMNDREN